jgi:hypothetical protein
MPWCIWDIMAFILPKCPDIMPPNGDIPPPIVAPPPEEEEEKNGSEEKGSDEKNGSTDAAVVLEDCALSPR